MIDRDRVKSFWDARAATYETLAFESIANLEQDPEYLQRKIRDETSKVFSWLPELHGKSLLDLGAGVGQWSLRFAERGARRVLAVEYSDKLAEIGRNEAHRRGMSAVKFQTSPAEAFATDERFDVVFISGLLVYMDDVQAAMLAGHLAGYCNSDALLMLRDGTGVEQRHEINDRYSAHLKTLYSATYRTRDQYLALFQGAGFSLVRDENMFEEGHPLNKYPETRLRLFLFKPRA